jgi:zinc D-Ala-D-Ala carboxypeptidase
MVCPCCWGHKSQPGASALDCGYCKGAGVVPDEQLSRHFKLSELLHSNTAIENRVPNVPTAEHLANLRRLCLELGDPVADEFGGLRLSSAYRSVALNMSVRGRTTGAHPVGCAMDAHPCDGSSIADVVEFLVKSKLPFDQVIWERTPSQGPWVHIGLLLPATGEQRRQALMTFDARTYAPFDARAYASFDPANSRISE